MQANDISALITPRQYQKNIAAELFFGKTPVEGLTRVTEWRADNGEKYFAQLHELHVEDTEESTEASIGNALSKMSLMATKAFMDDVERISTGAGCAKTSGVFVDILGQAGWVQSVFEQSIIASGLSQRESKRRFVIGGHLGLIAMQNTYKDQLLWVGLESGSELYGTNIGGKEYVYVPSEHAYPRRVISVLDMSAITPYVMKGIPLFESGMDNGRFWCKATFGTIVESPLSNFFIDMTEPKRKATEVEDKACV